MTKATLEFDLDSYDDKVTFELMQKASAQYSFIWEYDQLMRNMLKHGFEEVDTHLVTARDMLSHLRDKFHEMMTDHSIRPFD